MSKSGPISYYKVHRFKPEGTNFPYGIFIDNKNDNRCLLTDKSWCKPKDKSYNHDWGKQVTGAALEIYPHAPGTQEFKPAQNSVGGVRIYVDGFPVYANGGRYSADIGNVRLPKFGEPDVGKMNGYVYEKGTKVAKGRVTFDFFQNGGTRKTSTGYTVSGFASSSNGDTAYYTSGAVPNGSYKLYITDEKTRKKIIIDGLGIEGTGRRIDFDVAKKCFGYKYCEEVK